MSHERAALRDAVVAALTNTTSAGNRVSKNSINPMVGTFPKIGVYINSEVVIPESVKTSPRILERECDVEVVGFLAATDNWADAADALALQIETAMDADPHFDSNAYDSYLSGTELAERREGEKPMGAVVLTYKMTIQTKTRTTAPTDNFDTAGVTTNLENAQAEDDTSSQLIEDIYDGG